MSPLDALEDAFVPVQPMAGRSVAVSPAHIYAPVCDVVRGIERVVWDHALRVERTGIAADASVVLVFEDEDEAARFHALWCDGHFDVRMI